jgi:hypothetical protein
VVSATGTPVIRRYIIEKKREKTMERVKTDSDLEEQFGIVLMIDVLGVSRYTLEECKQFVINQKDFLDMIDKMQGIFEKSPCIKYSRIVTFGDTIVICWPIKEEEQIPPFGIIHLIGTELIHIIHWGISKGLLFRGCLSVGKYIVKTNTILGPAIFDANEWYNSADWFGIIFSPKSQLWLESTMESSKLENEKTVEDFIKNNVVFYEVPLVTPDKSVRTKKFWVSAWPFWYYNIKDSSGTPLEKISKELFKLPLPKDAESKFKNSMDFFKWYGNYLTSKEK